MNPVLVRGLLLRTLPVQLRKVLPRRRLDPRRLRHLLQPLLVALPVVAPHDRAHRRVRLQRRRVHAQRPAAQKTRGPQQLHHPAEHRRVRLDAQPLARLRQAGMLRRVLRESVSQELAQRNRVRAPPRDPPLRGDPLQIPHHQHPEVHPRRYARPTPLLRVELQARLLRELPKATVCLQSNRHPLWLRTTLSTGC